MEEVNEVNVDCIRLKLAILCNFEAFLTEVIVEIVKRDERSTT